jgi:hypothetical protein
MKYKPPLEWAGSLGIPEYRIVVDYVSEGEVANLIRGYVEIKGKRVRFTGVAYGRFGGQNFSPQLSTAAKKTIKQLTGDASAFEEDLQLKLVRGEFEAKPGKNEKHAHTHLGAA